MRKLRLKLVNNPSKVMQLVNGRGEVWTLAVLPNRYSQLLASHQLIFWHLVLPDCILRVERENYCISSVWLLKREIMILLHWQYYLDSAVFTPRTIWTDHQQTLDLWEVINWQWLILLTNKMYYRSPKLAENIFLVILKTKNWHGKLDS